MSESVVVRTPGGPVTCAACGCRLERAEAGWRHFAGAGGRDARGCRVPCAERLHAEGRRA